MNKGLKGLFSLKRKINLTDYTKLKGWGCKISKSELLSYLNELPKTKQAAFSLSPDCYISSIGNQNETRIASSLDYFYPLVDDPFIQGQITTCNILSDLYAMGITEIDHILVVLGLSDMLTIEERKHVAIEIMKGMNDKAEEAGCLIAGGQTVLNPWIMTGGSVLGTVGEFRLENNRARKGDKVLLTKPLGMQMIVNFKQYMRKDACKIDKLTKTGLFSEESFEKIFDKGVDHMRTLNLYASLLMQKYGNKIKACTDVTGFGVKGHCDNLLEIQQEDLSIIINTFPTFENFDKLDKIVRDFKLMEGFAAETSGGLLIVMDKDIVDDFQKELREDKGIETWIIGEVIEDKNRQTIIANDIDVMYV